MKCSILATQLQLLMKPMLRLVQGTANQSFNFEIHTGQQMKNGWHFHPELEIILLENTGGTRIIGDSVQAFSGEELLIIGSNIPHTFIHEEKYLKKTGSNKARAYVLHFRDNFLGQDFLALPELSSFTKFLTESERGLRASIETRQLVKPFIHQLSENTGAKRLLLLLEIVKHFAAAQDNSPIVSKGFIYNKPKPTDEDRLTTIYRFTADNYDQLIRIEDVASVINMTKESFCRYFKSKTAKTYFEFLIEFRIGNACRMLIENEMTVKDVGHSCGYDNISNFYHQFKTIMHKSPAQYQQDYFELASSYES